MLTFGPEYDRFHGRLHHYAGQCGPLGLTAVREMVEELCTSLHPGCSRTVSPCRHDRAAISVDVWWEYYEYLGIAPGGRRRVHNISFWIPREPQPVLPWEEELASIRAWQDSLDGFSRGQPHTDDQGLTDFILNWVRELTGYEGLRYGDLWIAEHKPGGGHRAAFGALTWCGERTMRKLTDKLGFQDNLFDGHYILRDLSPTDYDSHAQASARSASRSPSPPDAAEEGYPVAA